MNEKLELAESYIETGRYEKAIGLLNEIINAENPVKAYQMRGFVYYCLNDIDAAIPDLQYAVENDAQADLANYYLAQIHSLSGEFNKARDCLEKAVEINNENFEYLGDYITIELTLKNYQHGIELCNRLLEEVPDSNFALNSRGLALMALGKIDEAITDFKQAVKENSFDFSGWNNLGLAYMKRDDKEKAYAAFQSSLQLNHNNPDAYINISALLRQNGDNEKALKYLDRAISIDGLNPNAFKLRADVKIALNDMEGAKADQLRAKEQGYDEP
jgi:FimV-like protein